MSHVGLWDVVAGKSVLYKEGCDSVQLALISPSNDWVAFTDFCGGSAGTFLSAFSIAEARRIAKVELRIGGEEAVVAVNRDGSRLAFASGGGSVEVWEMPSGKSLAWVGHGVEVKALAFGSDASLLATGGVDGRILVWDLQRRAEVTRIQHGGEVTAVNFGTGDRWLASGDSNGKVIVSPLHAKDLVDEACTRLSTNFSQADWKRYLGDVEFARTCPRLPVPAPDPQP